MRLRPALVITVGAIVALAVWPFTIGFTHRDSDANVAPINDDYKLRDGTIAFFERQIRLYPRDQIQSRMLASQYLQRFREQGDLADVTRAKALAERSIKLQPQGNTGAQMALASALLSFHDFGAALTHEQDAIDGEPFNDGARAQKASLLMEMGDYDAAADILAKPPLLFDPTWQSIQARYDELTGKIANARLLIARAITVIDAQYSNSAYLRSWYHMRAGQLAFEAGDDATAHREYAESLRLFPRGYMTLMNLARLDRGERDWTEALTAAKRSADIYPLPQTLGYEADAQRALGDSRGARETDALIAAEERLFNNQGVNDRLLANYYAERGIHLDAALRFALSDHRKRGDEIYADDTLAWVYAARGDWLDARRFAVRATRLGTQDPEVQYHAALIALHTGHRIEAKDRFERALRSPNFHPVYASDARWQLAELEAGW